MARLIRPVVHGPTVRGRLRVDRGLLMLTGLVVALTTALLASSGPLTVRTADRATAQVVRDVGSGGDIVATLPSATFQGIRRRDPQSVQSFDQDTQYAKTSIPAPLADVMSLDVASLVSASLTVGEPGSGRVIRLAYLQTTHGSPTVTWTSGSAPVASPGAEQADQAALSPRAPPWPVQVGLSERAAAAIGVAPGDRLTAQDETGQSVAVRVSGIYDPEDPQDRAWRAAPELLQPTTGSSDGLQRTAVAGLVTPASLPDLRIAVPSDELTHQVTFTPESDRFGWQQTPTLRRQILALEASPGVTLGQISWASVLDRALDDALAQISNARGQALVLLVGLLATALLTLLLAAHLLVRRRAGSLALARERGATLPAIAAELTIESFLVAGCGALVGLAVGVVMAGSVDWRWAVPLVMVTGLAGPVLGALAAARATDARRVPANRAARRAGDRRRKARRVALEATVVGLTAVTVVALRQRTTVHGDLSPASAATWWSVAGALLLVRALPPLSRLGLRAARRTPGQARFLVAAQISEAGAHALPLLVVAVAVAQLVLGGTLAATERDGQASGALLAVGGDARLVTAPDQALTTIAERVSTAPDVRDAVAGRVADGVRVSSASTSASVRLLVVDAAAYEQLRSHSALSDAPQLAQLTDQRSDGTVPALVLGGPSGLVDRPVLRWAGSDTVPLTVVGVAPRVDASTDPVVVVDRAVFAAAGATADPNTVWAVGSGAAAALHAHVDAGASVATYADVLATRRDAPLAAGLVNLALAAAVLLLTLATLGILLGAAGDAPARVASLGRLRALGLPERGLRRVLAGELLVPVLASVLTGVAVGVGFALVSFGSLGLTQITGGSQTPPLALSMWTVLAVLLLPLTGLLIAGREGRALRRANLSTVLRARSPL